MVVIFYLDKVSALFKVLNDSLTSLKTIHTCILGIVFSDLGIICHDIDDLKVMTLSYLKVIRVMRRSDLNYTGTEIDINIIVGNNGDLTTYKRKDQHLADDILISLVLGIYCYSSITEKCLGSCSSKLDITAAVLERITKVPEMTCLIFVLNLGIGYGCKAMRTPVNDPLTSVYKSLIIVLNEYFLNSFGATFVHSETLVAPVTGRTDLLELLDDTSAVLLFPGPCSLKELLSSDIFLEDTFLTHRLNDLCLSSY